MVDNTKLIANMTISSFVDYFNSEILPYNDFYDMKSGKTVKLNRLSKTTVYKYIKDLELKI